jgi:Acetyltransferase (GNAT) domain
VLRPWQPADAPAVVAAYQDPGIRRWHVRSMNENEALAWIEAWPKRWRQESGCGWAVASDVGVLGQVSLRTVSLDAGAAEISYWVLPEARGRRIAQRALAAVTTWSFDVLGLHRIELNSEPGFVPRRRTRRLSRRGRQAQRGAARGRLARHAFARPHRDGPSLTYMMPGGHIRGHCQRLKVLSRETSHLVRGIFQQLSQLLDWIASTGAQLQRILQILGVRRHRRDWRRWRRRRCRGRRRRW